MRVLIVPNAHNDDAVAAARTLATWLDGRGDEPLLPAEDARACGLEPRAVTPDSFGDLDLVVALGGDGTILKAVHVLADRRAPILGVNLGRLGFLAGADGSELPEAVGAALEGRGTVERRCMLRIRATAGGRDAGTHHALNEVFVGRGPGGRAVDVQVEIDGEVLERAVCDGVIVATPTGSTAYALSVGGPVMAPSLRAMIVVVASPHTLSSRPVIAAESSVVTLTFPDKARSGACLMVDGDQVPCRSGLERVQVGLDSTDVSLVRFDGRGFYGALADTFFGV